jgi:hypothetical protein
MFKRPAATLPKKIMVPAFISVLSFGIGALLGVFVAYIHFYHKSVEWVGSFQRFAGCCTLIGGIAWLVAERNRSKRPLEWHPDYWLGVAGSPARTFVTASYVLFNAGFIAAVIWAICFASSETSALALNILLPTHFIAAVIASLAANRLAAIT